MEGFSSSFVSSVLRNIYLTEKILDPFSGIGTTPIINIKGVKSYYCEVNPILQHLVSTKSLILKLDRIDKKKIIQKIKSIQNNLNQINSESKLELDEKL